VSNEIFAKQSFGITAVVSDVVQDLVGLRNW